MACDPFESLLDRVFARSKPGDTLVTLDYPGESEMKITRTEAGIQIYAIEWYPAMGGRDWTENHELAAARDKLREMFSGELHPGRVQLETKFPLVFDED